MSERRVTLDWPDWFVEPLMRMAMNCAENTLVEQPIARISLALRPARSRNKP